MKKLDLKMITKMDSSEIRRTLVDLISTGNNRELTNDEQLNKTYLFASLIEPSYTINQISVLSEKILEEAKNKNRRAF